MNRSVPLPEELLGKAEELAEREQVSVEAFVSAKLAEQFARIGVSEASS